MTFEARDCTVLVEISCSGAVRSVVLYPEDGLEIASYW